MLAGVSVSFRNAALVEPTPDGLKDAGREALEIGASATRVGRLRGLPWALSL